MPYLGTPWSYYGWVVIVESHIPTILIGHGTMFGSAFDFVLFFRFQKCIVDHATRRWRGSTSVRRRHCTLPSRQNEYGYWNEPGETVCPYILSTLFVCWLTDITAQNRSVT